MNSLEFHPVKTNTIKKLTIIFHEAVSRSFNVSEKFNLIIYAALRNIYCHQHKLIGRQPLTHRYLKRPHTQDDRHNFLRLTNSDQEVIKQLMS